jgi:hypothetical protein
METDIRIQKGKKLAEDIWWNLAKRIVKLAGEHYKWTEEEWRDMMELFLRSGDYGVKVEIE